LFTPESSTLPRSLGPNRLPKQSGAQNKKPINVLKQAQGEGER